MKELKDGRTRKSGCYTCKYSKPETIHGRQEIRCLLDNMLVMRPSKGCAELKIVTNGDVIRRMTDKELAKFLVQQMILGAIQANGIDDSELIKSILDDTINSACGKRDIETALTMLRKEADEDAGTD